MSKKQKMITRILWIIILILRPFNMEAYVLYFGNTTPWYLIIVAFYVVFMLFIGIYASFAELPLSQKEKKERHKKYIEWIIEELKDEWYTVLPPQTN